MARLRRVLFVALAAIIVGTLPIPGAADDRTKEIAGLRAQQQSVARRLEATRDAREVRQTFLEDGCYFAVPILEDPLAGGRLATRDDALKLWTWMYLGTLGDQPFVQSEFEDFLKSRHDESLRMRDAIEDQIARMLEDEATLTREWRDLEEQVFILMQADATGAASGLDQPASADARTCAELVETNISDTALSAKASADPRAPTHGVSDEGAKNGQPLRINLSWTSLPPRLCEGDEVYVEMIATNQTPADSHLGLNYVASIELTGMSGVIETVSCSNAPDWVQVAPETTPVGPQMTEWVNGCVYRVQSLPDSDEPFVAFQANFGAMTGAGSVNYLYAVK